MSSTNRGAQRVENDQYMTPGAAIDSLLDVLEIPLSTVFNEPCRGTGAIYNRINCWYKQYSEIAEGVDYLTTPSKKYDLIITNPPYSLALDFLQKSLAEARSVFYLLRLNFLGSALRKPFWNANPPTHTLVLSQRPCFVWTCKDCKDTYQPGETSICTKIVYDYDIENDDIDDDIDNEGLQHVCGGKVRAGTDSIEYAWFGWDRAGYCTLPRGVHVL